ncbi:MAG TPA: hypothetical protein VLY63_00560, partial [Anaerolineae bacterium]|nr:hypothetical protein [Anaerolineae bacterium]
LLAPEGAALRRALIKDLLSDPEVAARHMEQLAPLLTSDRSLSGRDILDKLVAFLLSPEGSEVRALLADGVRDGRNGDGRMDLGRIMGLASTAGRLHPEFRTSTLIGSVGSYLLSEEGKPARNQILTTGAQWAVGGIVSALNRLAQPPKSPADAPALDDNQQKEKPLVVTRGVVRTELSEP